MNQIKILLMCSKKKDMSNFTEDNTPYGRFTRTQTSITYEYPYSFVGTIPPSCDVIIQVKYKKSGNVGVFDISYTNLVEKKSVKNYRDNFAISHCHPLAETIIAHDDESLMEGSIVAANPITFHMIECLMREETDEVGQYNTGVVTEKCYKSQIMRALTEMEL